MNIEYNGVIHKTKLTDKGHVVSEDGKLFFGYSEENIVQGVIVVEVIEEAIEESPK